MDSPYIVSEMQLILTTSDFLETIARLTAVGYGSVVGDEFLPSKTTLFLGAADGCNREIM